MWSPEDVFLLYLIVVKTDEAAPAKVPVVDYAIEISPCDGDHFSISSP